MSNYTLPNVPFFVELETSQNVLLVGMGGGYDIVSGIPIYLALRNLGKNVILGNLSFAWLDETNAIQVQKHCYQIEAHHQDFSGRRYFPEKHLKQWLLDHQLDTTIYAFPRTGVQSLLAAYQWIIQQHSIDTIILVDGGTDSLMRGNEEELGTPLEDSASLVAANELDIAKKLLVCIGFGIDHFHGVSHYLFLENIAQLIQQQGFLGAFHLTNLHQEFVLFEQLIQYLNAQMAHHQSIVSNSILDAISGKYGDVQSTNRTNDSQLWINPLMGLYWSFPLDKVAANLLYYKDILHSKTIKELTDGIWEFRKTIREFRLPINIPL